MKYANVTYSFSVNNMQNSMLQYSKYGRITAVEGGRPFSGIAYLIDWLGIYPDEYDGYDELGKISSLYLTPDDIHIQNVVVIPARKTTGDNDLIKMALMKYGGVATGIYYDNGYLLRVVTFSNDDISSGTLIYVSTLRSNANGELIGGSNDDTSVDNNIINSVGNLANSAFGKAIGYDKMYNGSRRFGNAIGNGLANVNNTLGNAVQGVKNKVNEVKAMPSAYGRLFKEFGRGIDSRMDAAATRAQASANDAARSLGATANNFINTTGRKYLNSQTADKLNNFVNRAQNFTQRGINGLANRFKNWF
jgi:hypothetical protein